MIVVTSSEVTGRRVEVPVEKVVPVDATGRVDLEALAATIDAVHHREDTVAVVSVMAVLVPVSMAGEPDMRWRFP